MAARVIADQLRLRRGALQEIRPRNGVLAEMRVLVAHRRDLLQDQTRRAARLREVLSSVFPGLKAEIVKSLPGMGVVFTAEFLAEAGDLGRFASADSLAAAAGITPVLRASGATSFQRRARRGNMVLKRVLYRSAFSCISHHGRSEAFYRRKRAEDHHQAVSALARRRVHVLWAMLRDGETYCEQPAQTALLTHRDASLRWIARETWGLGPDKLQGAT